MEYRTPAQLGFLKPAYQIAELSAVLPIGRSQIYKEIAAGRLKAFKVGGRSAVLAVDAADYLLAAARGGEVA